AKRRKRRKRRWVAGLAAVALVAGTAWAVLTRDGSVGHFRSIEGRDRFMANYQRAMRRLPKPEAAFDLRTSFGVVRMYRFRGANPSLPPLVLLPGRAAPTPFWGDNLPSLLAQRNVYTVDLLGEPGASVQGSPIRTHGEQARWLHEALAGLPEGRLHLLGLSGGGWTAMNLVVRHPVKVASLTLLEPAVTFADLPFEDSGPRHHRRTLGHARSGPGGQGGTRNPEGLQGARVREGVPRHQR
ncbi:alpha/beta fold hydrolase, partial [Actinomadura adrarensis]